ncbi:type I-E CRISPR-associated endoribonuclease Cas2e [Stutzerimonas stutzeri]|uniref:type I-E CRISPR-associated endoribonuclease Cas2e n=1 Tax=Stutzerimonas stutzeri TaxID=316 RepID=UPI003B82B510
MGTGQRLFVKITREWFVEPKPNVFISGIKVSVATTVIDYLYKHCPPESGIVMFRSLTAAPGYEI